MEQMTNYQGAGLTRIESVEDKEVNRAMFTLYSHLISPLAELEQTSDELEATEQRINYLKGGASIQWNLIPSVGGPVGVVLIIACLILGDFITFRGPFAYLNHSGLLRGILYLLVMGMVVGVVVTIASFFVEKASMAEGLQKSTQEREELAKKKDYLIENIQNVICYVPPKYRFASALQYFVESYENSRVDNLKEAVNAFDTYYFREETTALQRQMISSQQQMMRMLDQIQFRQIEMMGQLDNIQADVWLS
jgi:uncharacterized membrane protein